MPASKIPRPLRRAARWTDTTAYEVTEAAKINSLPDTPLPYELTLAGRGEYLPTQGKFKEGSRSPVRAQLIATIARQPASLTPSGLYQSIPVDSAKSCARRLTFTGHNNDACKINYCIFMKV